MKPTLGFVLAAACLAGCNSSSVPATQETGKFLCVPSNYLVPVPGGSGSGSGSGSGDDDDLYDSDGGGYDISILIKPDEAAHSISGYKSQVQVGDSSYFQALYVMLSTDSHFRRPISSIEPTRPLKDHPHLSRETADDFVWQVIENNDNTFSHWGSCMDQFTGDGSYDCQRVLIIQDLVLTYPIDQVNIPVYEEIDDLLREKVDQWRCDSGRIPIERENGALPRPVKAAQ